MGPPFILWPLVWVFLLFALGTGLPLLFLTLGMGLFFYICPWVWAWIDFFALGMGVGLCDQMFNVDPLPVPAGLGEKWSLESRLTSSVLDFNMPGQVRLGA